MLQEAKEIENYAPQNETRPPPIGIGEPPLTRCAKQSSTPATAPSRTGSAASKAVVAQEAEVIHGKRRGIGSDRNGARLRHDGRHFRYYCPLCGLKGPRAETAEEAEHGWRAATYQWRTAEQASTVEEQALPTGGLLDESELRIIQILYKGKGCAAGPQVSREPVP